MARNVVAGLIWNQGKILVCQRRKWDTFALLWEFPGGKLEPNETPAEGLRRELREELGVEASIGAEIYRTGHRYTQMKEPLELIFFHAKADPGAMRPLAFEQIRWLTPDSLPELEFLPADREFVERLSRGDFPPPESLA
ncbi:MAG TPA: (deoxy)nucleoside triphosphate pyrophosphohydrolase [Verrucomicrobiae bacterium]|nr:(deoxy)nucleoside triphosphate pyrophosphohydrolase [Verrucomicrobiae bacterium]